MDTITLIVTALSAGASAGAIDSLSDDIKSSAKSAYIRMRHLVMRRAHGDANTAIVIAEHSSDPKPYEASLAQKLAELNAGEDQELVEAAKSLLELLNRAGAGSNKYHVSVADSKGMQIGDGNHQVNNF
jgi:hypothetical protein